jgi:hypothetical protein
MDEERRRKTRVQFTTQVVVKTEESEIVTEANSEDISIKGIFVNTEEKIPAGTSYDVEILLMGTSTRLVPDIKGVITRQDETGLGNCF